MTACIVRSIGGLVLNRHFQTVLKLIAVMMIAMILWGFVVWADPWISNTSSALTQGLNVIPVLMVVFLLFAWTARPAPELLVTLALTSLIFYINHIQWIELSQPLMLSDWLLAGQVIKMDEQRRAALPTIEGLDERAAHAYRNYLYHQRHAISALSDLWRHVKRGERPTVILFFGDHLPGLHETFAQAGLGHGFTPLTHPVPYLLLSTAPTQPQN